MIGFFDLCFACNIRTTYEECEVWRKLTSFEDILKCSEKWRLYNEQTIEQ